MESAPEIPAPWRRALDRIDRRSWRRVLVLGATDRGKSTFCGFLVRGLAARGREVVFLDADPGQKDAGPPGTVSLARGEAERPLSSLPVEALHFIGAVSPMGHFPGLVAGASRLAAGVTERTVVIDTPGLVYGPGRLLLELQLEALRPDVVVALERERELDSLLAPWRDLNVIRLAQSGRARARSAGERRRAREAGFRQAMKGARERSLPIDALAFHRTVLFSGRPVEAAGTLWTEMLPEGRLAVGGLPAGCRWHLTQGFERGVLCGLLDRNQVCLGLGVIRVIDFEQGKLRLLSPVGARRIRAVQPGELRLREDGGHSPVPRLEWFPR